MSPTINQLLKKSWTRIVFFILGFGSLVWFLVRVIPKPSRASYPCVKATAPLASSFVLYLIGISGSAFLFRKARERIMKSKYLLASVCAILGFVFGLIALINNNNTALANDLDLQLPQASNEPIGEAKGIFPGRVVWIHNPDATNESCTNVEGDYWFQENNTNTPVVQDMLSEGLQNLTGTTTDTDAWKELFTDFNSTHGRGKTGYKAGEKIAIKINLNNIWYGNGIEGINTSAQLMYALIDQLVNVVGVKQYDIGIGDPSHFMEGPYYEKCYADFPDVDYWGSLTGSWADYTSSDILIASDGSSSSSLPLAYVNATYLFNVPVLKKHHRAGISVTSKNHFGSLGSGASVWHSSLPVPDGSEFGDETNPDYGIYRCFVDIMGHKDLGGKTILYLVDGLWGATNYSHPPVKWEMSPFNNDWPNSLFLSQDPVAVESVCFDFLYEEFDEDHPTEGLPVTYDKGPFPHFPGTDDFLHQSADKNNWPVGVKYDPENDGTYLESLGTHEHWNNARDKQYSRNLGTGNGIELYYQYKTSIDEIGDISEGFSIDKIYPNPFSESTTITYNLAKPSKCNIQIFDTSGKLVFSENSNDQKNGKERFIWYGTATDGTVLSKGQYILRIHVATNERNFDMNSRLLFN